MKIGPALPQGSVIFCDDIRQEIGGKRSIMGMYDAEMSFTDNPPYILPTFCALITWKWDMTVPPSSIKFALFKDVEAVTEELFSAEVELPEPPPIEFHPNASDPDAPRVGQMQFVAKFAGFQLDANCILRMRAFIGDDEHRIGGLRISRAPVSEEA